MHLSCVKRFNICGSTKRRYCKQYGQTNTPEKVLILTSGGFRHVPIIAWAISLCSQRYKRLLPKKKGVTSTPQTNHVIMKLFKATVGLQNSKSDEETSGNAS